MSRVRAGRSRIAVGIAAIATAGLTAAGIVHFPDLERAYHLGALRREPERLAEMLKSSRAAKQEAARIFTNEPVGKEALFRHFLSGGVLDSIRKEALDLGSEGVVLSYIREPPAGVFVDGGFVFGSTQILVWRDDSFHHCLFTERLLEPESAKVDLEVFGLLRRCSGALYRSAGSDLEFLVQDASSPEPRWPDRSGPPRGPRMIEKGDWALPGGDEPKLIIFFRKTPRASS